MYRLWKMQKRDPKFQKNSKLCFVNTKSHKKHILDERNPCGVIEKENYIFFTIFGRILMIFDDFWWFLMIFKNQIGALNGDFFVKYGPQKKIWKKKSIFLKIIKTYFILFLKCGDLVGVEDLIFFVMGGQQPVPQIIEIWAKWLHN